MISVIMKRELKSYFTSPVAYIVTCAFLIVSGFMLFSFFFLANRAELREFFVNLPWLFAIFIPALTMRLFSEERGRGTIETLMTLPVTCTDVVIGKFLAAFVSSIIMLVPTFIYAITASIFGDVDFGTTFGVFVFDGESDEEFANVVFLTVVLFAFIPWNPPKLFVAGVGDLFWNEDAVVCERFLSIVFVFVAIV